MTKVDFRMRLARQGLFACLPLPSLVDSAEGSTDGLFEDKEQLKGCIKLWRTVIDRTLLYALSPNEEEVEKALQWFRRADEKTTKNFNKVCHLASLDPLWVSEKALSLYKEFRNKKYFQYE